MRSAILNVVLVSRVWRRKPTQRRVSACFLFAVAAVVAGENISPVHADSLIAPNNASASTYLEGLRYPNATIDGSGMTPDFPVTVIGIDGATATSTCGTDPTPNNLMGAMWLSRDEKPAWIGFELEQTYTLTGFHLWNYNEVSWGVNYTPRGVRDMDVYAGSDSNYGTWTGQPVQSYSLAGGNPIAQADGTTTYTGADYTFSSPITTRYLKFNITSNWSATENWIGISEIRFTQAFLEPSILALESPSNATIITGGMGTLGATVKNTAGAGANHLKYSVSAAVLSGTATLGTVLPGSGSLVPGTSEANTVNASSTSIGANMIRFTASDPNASNSPQTIDATLNVLGHAAAAFEDGSTVLNADFGVLQANSIAIALLCPIKNLPGEYRAKLDLDSVIEVSDAAGVFRTSTETFRDLSPGGTCDVFVVLNRSIPGHFTGQYRFNLSDQKDLSGHAGAQTLTLNVTANVVPEPSTLALLGIGAVGLLACGWRRRLRSRQALSCTAILLLALSAGIAQADVFNMGSGLTSLEMVLVGNPGNTGELSGAGAGGSGPDRICGAVNYVYEIGKYEVTAGQYTEFLNKVAATDAYGLYNPNMYSSSYGCKIRRLGTSGNYAYLVDANGDGVEDADWVNRPVNYVTWGGAARFCNWLQNGQPNTGVQDLTTTEDGAYYLNGATSLAELLAVTRKADWKWAITNEDEWYKAAYYDPVRGGYWQYPTGSNTVPVPEEPPGTDATDGSANYNLAVGSLTDVGAYTYKPSTSPYGAFDMAGNALEWNETLSTEYSAYFLRGGASLHDSYALRACDRGFPAAPTGYSYDTGFRVASIPEPSTFALLAGAVLFAAAQGFALYCRPAFVHRASTAERDQRQQ